VQELPRQAGGLDVFGVKVDHVARREGWCGGVAAVVIPCHIVLCLSQHRLGCLKGVFHPICELVNRFDTRRRLMRFEAHLGVSAGDDADSWVSVENTNQNCWQVRVRDL